MGGLPGVWLGRIVGGAFAGAVFGLFTELLIFWTSSDGGARLPVVGPALGALLVGVVAHVAGHWRFRGWSQLLIVGQLQGLILGAVCGFIVLSPFMNMNWKADFAIGLRAGTLLGMLFGSALGLFAALALGLWRRWHGEPLVPGEDGSQQPIPS